MDAKQVLYGKENSQILSREQFSQGSYQQVELDFIKII